MATSEHQVAPTRVTGTALAVALAVACTPPASESPATVHELRLGRPAASAERKPSNEAPPSTASAAGSAPRAFDACKVEGDGELWLDVMTSAGRIGVDVSGPFVARPVADKGQGASSAVLSGIETNVELLGPPLRLSAMAVTHAVLRTRRLGVPGLTGELPAGLVVETALQVTGGMVHVTLETVQGTIELDIPCDRLAPQLTGVDAPAAPQPAAGATWHLEARSGRGGVALRPAPDAAPVAMLNPTAGTPSAVERLEVDGRWARIRFSLGDDAALEAWVAADVLAPGARSGATQYGLIGLLYAGGVLDVSGAPRAATLREGAAIYGRAHDSSAPWAHTTVGVAAVVHGDDDAGWWRLMKIDGVEFSLRGDAAVGYPAWVHASDVELREARP